MNVVVLIGRILFSVLFLFSAVGHFTGAEGMAQYAASKKVPSPKAGVYLSGLAWLLGGVSVLLGIWGDIGALIIFLALIPVNLMMHAFWQDTDPMDKQNNQIQFNKNLALMGAALIIYVLFAHEGHCLGLTLTGPLTHLG